MTPTHKSRRTFLKSTAAASLAPFVLPSGLRAQDAPSSKKLRMGFVGMGKQSGHLLNNFISQDDVHVLAVCDVDTTRREHGKAEVDKKYGNSECAAVVEFEKITDRDDIDAICIATPDHWHTIITMAALENGKDVYCEKPLTHNIHESKVVMEAVPKHGRVLQNGSMQRSMSEFRVACELVRNGAIGKLDHVECSFGDPGVPCDLPAEEMEPGLDWDRWLGPAQERPYHSELSPRGLHNHFPNWRNYREFGGGMVTDWGAHHLDIAQWGLGRDESGPTKILPPDDWEEGKSKRGAKLVYDDGVYIVHGGGIGVHFFGSEGEVEVTRGRFAFRRGGETVAQFLSSDDKVSLASQLIKAEKEFLQDAEVKLYKSEHHIRDFIDAVAARKQPITHEEIGARSAICCHLMNLAYYHGQEIEWNPDSNTFANNTGDPAWLTRDYRSPWSV
ncbi:Gfo/Idh/MocA family oxidoreductase [soil metagenome]